MNVTYVNMTGRDGTHRGRIKGTENCLKIF